MWWPVSAQSAPPSTIVASLAGDGVLVERRFGQVPVDLGEVFETEFVGAIGAVPHTRFLHANSSQTGRPFPARTPHVPRVCTTKTLV